MKGKVLAICALLLLAGTTMALESGPSNPVGFFTITVTHPTGASGYNLVSFPVLPASTTLTNVIGSQLPGGTSALNSTTIYNWVNNGSGAGSYVTNFYRTTGGWSTTSSLQNIDARKGYFIKLLAAAPTSVNVVVAGNVNVGPVVDMGTVYTGLNMIGSVYAADVPLANSNLYTVAQPDPNARMWRGSALTADILLRMTNGAYQTAFVNSSGVWVAGSTSYTFNSLEPGRGYFLKRLTAGGRTSFAWPNYPVPAGSSSDSWTTTYTSTSAPAVIDMGTPVNTVKSTKNSLRK